MGGANRVGIASLDLYSYIHVERVTIDNEQEWRWYVEWSRQYLSAGQADVQADVQADTSIYLLILVLW